MCVALADKLDTLVGFFEAGERPTGSGDRFGLRRTALGIIRILLDAGVSVPLRPLIAYAGVGVAASVVSSVADSRLNSLNYRYDHIAYILAMLRGIPVWMRCETQDEACSRTWLKSLLRSGYYRLLYVGIRQAFPIGVLSRQHWLRHGLPSHRLRDAHYCTPDRAASLTVQQCQSRRQVLREQLGIQPDQLLVAFFGKLIAKKDPGLLLQALPHMPAGLRERLVLLFVGSGELQVDLQNQASKVQSCYGVETHFPGFVNQSALIDWYLAADVVVLPSRRAGETWGLVVNEAMQAGCAVVVSEAVGCAFDFAGWQRFRTIPVGSAAGLASALEDLAVYPRSFAWAANGLRNYSVDAAAKALAGAILELA
jgi:glycosyltransferase involved in cell wall biosynthesis